MTSAELEVVRTHVLDLAKRVRTACGEKLRGMSPTGTIPDLSTVPAVGDVVELPELTDLGDIKAVEAWREAVAQMSYKRGHRTGIEEGEAKERSRAIIEVLQRRGIPLTEEQAQKIATCRDQSTLTHWWDRAWFVSSADEL